VELLLCLCTALEELRKGVAAIRPWRSAREGERRQGGDWGKTTVGGEEDAKRKGHPEDARRRGNNCKMQHVMQKLLELIQ
jgi:hypothetical protein